MADHTQLQDGAVDPNVHIPKSVLDAAAAAEAAHRAVYALPAPELAPAAHETDPAPTDPPPAASAPAEPAAIDPVTPAAPAAPHSVTDPDDENSQTYKQKFLSMQGRWHASQRQLGERDEMINQLAGELRATQQIVEQNSSQARTSHTSETPHFGHPHEKLITQQDVDAYGNELIDVVQRAAREVMAPELDALRGENADLKKRVITTGQRTLREQLTDAVPNWTAINRSQEFARWLSLRNIYTGQVRRQMLNDAYQAANAAVVVQMFRDFQTEAKATGNTVPTSQQSQQQPASIQAPAAQRQPAMDLGSLAAPGRARPAPGDAQVPAEKPIYTRALISKNYSDRRRGLWNGREADWNALEADMIAAGNEGRVRG